PFPVSPRLLKLTQMGSCRIPLCSTGPQSKRWNEGIGVADSKALVATCYHRAAHRSGEHSQGD
ncbi:MAG TPA: hypothetical protein VN952_06745, partial [Chthoniobacterales bacterium]|nr:hypothetical protein [Chthoniobacterales bacterium]